VHDSLAVLVAVPDTTLSTAEARRATADPVGTEVAVRTAARLAFLVEGLRTGDPALLAEAQGDELHEERRAHLSPITGKLVEAARRAGALHAAWSGAGPAVVAFVTGEDTSRVAEAWRAALDPPGGVVLDPGIDRSGLVVGAG
jgi:homoserine kinase